MEQIQRNTDRLSAREKLLERVKNFTLLSDVFLSVALRDKAACQHVLRLLTGKEKLTANIWKREKNKDCMFFILTPRWMTVQRRLL